MQLVEFEVAKKLLSKYKILSPRTIFVSSEKEASKVAKDFKYPVFLKIYGKNILHRTEKGGVGEATNKIELLRMFSKMIRIKGTEGVLIQEKVLGKSLILGMKRDPQFGSVIIVGIGGIFTEVLNDVVLMVAPIAENEALKMLSELKGYAYLCGKRDNMPINLKAVVKIIIALSDLAQQMPEIKEIDLNPVIVNGKKAVAVDFKFLT